MSIVGNEKRKLTANYLNGLAIAAAAVGCFSPVISFFNAPPAAPTYVLALIVLVCLGLSTALHFRARGVLEGLEP